MNAGTLHSLATCKDVPTIIVSFDMFKASDTSAFVALLLHSLADAGVTGLHQPSQAEINAAFKQHVLPTRMQRSHKQARAAAMTASQVGFFVLGTMGCRPAVAHGAPHKLSMHTMFAPPWHVRTDG